MLISKTSQYAIQGMIFVAMQPVRSPVLCRSISDRLNVPSAYMAKIMQDLSRHGLLVSYRGRNGGFALAAKASETSLMSILQVTEGRAFTESCLLGLKLCSNASACPMHHEWLPIKEQIIEMLRKQNLEVLSNAVKAGEYRLSDLPQGLDKIFANQPEVKQAQ